ncbi:MAG: hypothetical protein JWQ28_2765 [Pedobacter sp.]|jgi:uncharacterized membrane protein YcaP (DUF421 family)|nr:hypothetical protein [Pedobacter sp.]
MVKEKYSLGDLHRILIGDVPAVFFIEVIIRTVLIYIILIVSIRLMGKRMALQLNVTEMTAMVALAAAIGVPIQAPDRGILPAAVIAIVVVISERVITRIIMNNKKAETRFQGDMNVLVEESALNFTCIKDVGMSRSLVLQQLRARGIDHLGKVKRLYMETSGAFSIVEQKEIKPGLSVIPEHDQDYWKDVNRREDVCVCSNCGLRRDTPAKNDLECENCGKNQWEPAVL